MEETRDENCVERQTVNRLENLAIEASFNQILRFLRQCPDQKKSVDSPLETPTDSGSPFSSSEEQVIKTVRGYLDKHLVGTVNAKARAAYVKKMYGNFTKFQYTKSMKSFFDMFSDRIKKLYSAKTAINMPLFLACVLDDSLEELKIPVTFPFKEVNPNLLTVVGQHGANIKTLKLNFSRVKQSTRYSTMIPMIKGLSSLQHLTSLSLYYLSDHNRLIIQPLGKACPSLTYLKISRGCRVQDLDVDNIVLGELGEYIMLDTEEYSLRVPTELLSPMCFSLRHLHLAEPYWEDYNDNYFLPYYHPIVFALRHLPLLEKMDGYSTCMGVKLLHDAYANQNEEAQTKFEAKCKKYVPDGFDMDQNLPYRVPTFSGTLALTRLDCVPARNADILKVVGSMCPNLKEVRFLRCLPRCRRQFWDDEMPKEVNSTALEIESTLRAWPQLENIAIVNVPSEYINVILKVFGSNLKHLTIENSKNVDLSTLMNFTRLESVVLKDGVQLKRMTTDKPTLNPGLFLPKLKTLESEICLGAYWTRVFEQKASLTRVALNCCHIGTKGSSCADWTYLPKMWPSLEALHILQCDGLTLPMVPGIVHQLGGLKEISVPERARSKQKKLVPGVVADFTNRPSPIRLRFILESHDDCPFLKHLVYDESSSDSSSEEGDYDEDVVSDDGDEEWEDEEESDGEDDYEEEEEEDEDGEEGRRQRLVSDSDSLESF